MEDQFIMKVTVSIQGLGVSNYQKIVYERDLPLFEFIEEHLKENKKISGSEEN
jgi:hypothetical protein